MASWGWVGHPLTQGYRKRFACISISYNILRVSSLSPMLCAGIFFFLLKNYSRCGRKKRFGNSHM